RCTRRASLCPYATLFRSTYISEGSLLQNSMVIPAPELEAGEREIAIMVNAETGVAGKVSRQSRVDIYATFPSDGDADSCATRVRSEEHTSELQSRENLVC